MYDLGLGYLYLNPEEQIAYEVLLDALKKYSTCCDISSVERSVDISKVVSTVLGDHPNIIYFNKTQLRTMSGVFIKQLSFTGCIPKKQIIKKEQQLKAAIEEAVWDIDKNSRSDKEILQGITEYLQRSVRYDYDELSSIMKRSAKVKFPDSHNAYGALVNHKAVCDGFSSAYAAIAQSFGFRCMMVEGKSSHDNSAKVNHAWNIVDYENNFYHIDAAWDANAYEVSKHYSYIYFGQDDDGFLLDHDWDYHYTPKCNANKLSIFTSMIWLLIASLKSKIS